MKVYSSMPFLKCWGCFFQRRIIHEDDLIDIFTMKKFTTTGKQQQQTKKLPLHTGFDVDQDLVQAVAADNLKCFTALKDWTK